MTDESEKTKDIDVSIANHPKIKELIAASPKRKMAEPKLIDEISALIKTGTSENKILALEKIESSGVSFPSNFEMPIFTQLRKDPDERVKTKANEVFNKKFGPYLKEFSKTLEEFSKVYGRTFQKLSSDVVATSAVYDASHNIAKIFRNSLTVPINSITLTPVFEMVKSQQKIFESLAIQPLFFPDFSPIFATSAFVSRLADVADPGLTIPQALGKSVPEIERELDNVIESDEDAIFNFEGYAVLYHLERFLRDLIEQKICLKEPKMISNRIPKEIINQWKYRREEEKKNSNVSGQYDLIDYSDFTDLKMIFEKGKNIQLFRDICSEEQFRAVISKMNELDPIRKKIAHSRPLRKEEFDRLKMYAEDIDRILNRPHDTEKDK
jgi:hypothetical protein